MTTPPTPDTTLNMVFYQRIVNALDLVAAIGAQMEVVIKRLDGLSVESITVHDAVKKLEYQVERMNQDLEHATSVNKEISTEDVRGRWEFKKEFAKAVPALLSAGLAAALTHWLG